MGVGGHRKAHGSLLCVLDGIHELGTLVAHLGDLLIALALHLVVFLAGQASLIVDLEVEMQHGEQGGGQDEQTDGSRVAWVVGRLKLVGEEERGGHASRVANGELEPAAKGSFAVPRIVGCEPG